jgi:hypothetical protein
VQRDDRGMRSDPPRPSGTPADAPPAPIALTDAGPWAALRHPVFRLLWLASGAYFIANAMHLTAVAWLTVERTGSSCAAPKFSSTRL